MFKILAWNFLESCFLWQLRIRWIDTSKFLNNVKLYIGNYDNFVLTSTVGPKSKYV